MTSTGDEHARRAAAEEAVRAALEVQKDRDLLGPPPVALQLAHSRGFALALGPAPRRAIDLGSGGGVPGMVLGAQCWPETRLTMLDRSQRRCDFLDVLIGRLGLPPRVDVHWGRAEDIGRDPSWRGGADAVVARSFGGPATTAECAAPLLEVGGALVVSEPPGTHGERWDPTGLARLGMELESVEDVQGAKYARIRQVQPCPEEFPRRPGLPARRPLF